jgi:hypothetical protein
MLIDSPLQSSRLLEALRGKPRALVYAVIAAHALAMAVAMLLSEATPPRAVVEALAIGREHLLGTAAQPPLTAWVLELFYWLGGGLWALVLAGALADAVALWAVYRLARAIVGERQAALATVLAAGVAWVTWLPPALDADRLLLPLFALAALHLWRAALQGRRKYWALVALDLALMIATRYEAIVLGLVLMAALAASPRGRAVFRAPEPWGAMAIAGALVWPHFLWIATSQGALALHGLAGAGLHDVGALLTDWGALLGLAVLGHAGLAGLIALLVVPRPGVRADVPMAIGPKADVTARRYAWTLALAPAPAMALVGLVFGRAPQLETLVPLFAFSGLAAVLALGPAIPLHRHGLAGRVLAVLTLAPAVVAVVLAVALPYGRARGADTNWPSAEMARWFTEVYRIRTGQKLAIVAGDAWTAGALALASHDRPRLYLDGNSERAPWIKDERVKRAGVLVVWRVEGSNAAPPPGLAARFPAMAIETPRSFDWAIKGRLSPIRIGWAVIPPEPE